MDHSALLSVVIQFGLQLQLISHTFVSDFSPFFVDMSVMDFFVYLTNGISTPRFKIVNSMCISNWGFS